ncbi:unnamed protein product [Adineta steineri]|uniref:USP domain-containing protein n=2 Tax=Adineta steineri TaxID=433720 RepID=A0A813Z5E2_9BILA|nr:unnamed protein product [Adineta steineri]
MNSANQCLSNIPKFMEWVQVQESSSDQITVTQAYITMIKSMWSGENSYVTPHNIKQRVSRHNSIFGDYAQKDSHEFMNSTLHALHAGFEQNNSSKEQSSIVTDLFRIRTESAVTCLECDFVEMAGSRPLSLIINEEAINTAKVSKKRPAPKHGRSSSSSVDSSNAANMNSTNNDNNSSTQNFLRTTTTLSTTTDSDIESEQDDNQPIQSQKNDSNSQEQLSRREKHFYKLFKSELNDDMPELIDSYVCAYQGDILLQGKMYITDRYLCFHSRIISYVTKHVHRWEHIEDVSKERVAFIFPTAIGIQLKRTEKKLIYASFLQRDQAYEKIYSIWSRHVNDISSYDDEENDIVNDGTLKATNHNIRAPRESYDIIDEPEQDDAIDMYLKNNHKRPVSLLSTKSSNEKQTSKLFMNSHNKKTTDKNLTQKLSNNSHDNISNATHNIRHSRFIKSERKQNEIEHRNNSVVNYRSKPTASRSHQGQSQDRLSASANQTTTHSNLSSTPIQNINVPTSDAQSNGILIKLLKLIISCINLFTQKLSSLFHHLQILSLKTTTFILIFLLLLFIHAFYLIKVASRIENRLQSLHPAWSSASIKDSLTSNAKEL